MEAGEQGPGPRTSTSTQGVPPRPGSNPRRRPLGDSAFVDGSDAKFRHQERAVGKCTGEKLEAIQYAYSGAYVICAAAKHELDQAFVDVKAIAGPNGQARGANVEKLWNGYHQHREASLGYWFGEEVPQRGQAREAVEAVWKYITRWEEVFRKGFWRKGQPVFIRCKSVEPVGDPPARHLVRNTIEISPRFFDASNPPAMRVISLLHEMGHWMWGVATKPRDERHDLCTGGWNIKENMCYRDTSEVRDFGSTFRFGNPALLARRYDDGDSSLLPVMLNNIDNYVCYMWNRYADREKRGLRSPLAPRNPVSGGGKSV